VGSADPERLLKLEVPEILLTVGSEGSFVIAHGHVEHVPAVEIADLVDPTGAGDTFAMAYLAERAAGAEPLDGARAAAGAVADLLAGR
jgi:sugar/nucleoside kinase (ribokinase family)